MNSLMRWMKEEAFDDAFNSYWKRANKTVKGKYRGAKLHTTFMVPNRATEPRLQHIVGGIPTE